MIFLLFKFVLNIDIDIYIGGSSNDHIFYFWGHDTKKVEKRWIRGQFILHFDKNCVCQQNIKKKRKLPKLQGGRFFLIENTNVIANNNKSFRF